MCAGPGGFTEYVLWRKEGGGKRRHGGARGWGFTLKGEDDWKLHKFSPDAPTFNFSVHYGVDETGILTQFLNKILPSVIDYLVPDRCVA